MSIVPHEPSMRQYAICDRHKCWSSCLSVPFGLTKVDRSCGDCGLVADWSTDLLNTEGIARSFGDAKDAKDVETLVVLPFCVQRAKDCR